ncbi:hypothetical protein Hanom_Chr09g00807961 [Helianthus anomalus]
MCLMFYVFLVDPKGKTNVFTEDRSLSSIVVSDVSISNRICFSIIILNYVFIYLFRPCRNVGQFVVLMSKRVELSFF